MNVTEYTLLLKTPATINTIQSETLEKIVHDFPYFQSARALQLKTLYNQNSFRYNVALKITAAHTTDRSVLFDFITSESFSTTQIEVSDDKLLEMSESTTPKLEQKLNTLEESILTSIKSALTTDEINSETHSEKLIIGEPLAFSTKEKHSFEEWLQLTVFKPIQREENNLEATNYIKTDSEKKIKSDLIDKFIETNPKIPPIKPTDSIPSVFFEDNDTDESSLMTETLARVYLEQKKYQKAIQAYEILILKNPKKSSFFADRILDIKNLQQKNT